jgi:ribose/xylose/arabinose/galactoside ABC-type transport system permease subunit
MTETVPSPAAETPAIAQGRQGDRKFLRLLVQGDRPYMLYVAFAILLVIFSLASPWFLSLDNFLNIGRQTALVSIVAMGMTFVIIARQIDLSVGSTLALSGMCAALAMAHVADNWLIGAVAGIGAGALVGLINGVLTTRLAIPSFLVTLGSLSAARGLALMLTNTKPVIITNETYFAIFGEGYFAGMPAPIAWTALATIVGVLLLHYSVYGRQIYAAIRPRRSIRAFTSSASRPWRLSLPACSPVWRRWCFPRVRMPRVPMSCRGWSSTSSPR